MHGASREGVHRVAKETPCRELAVHLGLQHHDVHVEPVHLLLDKRLGDARLRVEVHTQGALEGWDRQDLLRTAKVGEGLTDRKPPLPVQPVNRVLAARIPPPPAEREKEGVS